MTLYRSVYPFLMEFRKNPEDTIQKALGILKVNEGYATEEQVVVLANILTGEGYCTTLQIRTIPAV